MNMFFEASVIELKTELVKMNTNTGTAAYLMMKNAPKAYNWLNSICAASRTMSLLCPKHTIN